MKPLDIWKLLVVHLICIFFYIFDTTKIRPSEIKVDYHCFNSNFPKISRM